MELLLRVVIGPNSRHTKVIEVEQREGEALFHHADDSRSNNLVDRWTVAQEIEDTMQNHHLEDLWKVVSVTPVEEP